MSFWAGVVQGVKDIDVLKEKEALADERQSVRDEENAYRARMDAVKAKQQEFADERALAWRREDQATAAEQDAYQREQDRLAAEERAAAVAYRAKIDDRNFDWGKEVFWIGQERTDASILVDMKKWDYSVAQDAANAALAAIDKETDQERYDFQVERLEQLDLINAAAVEEDSRRYGIAQERLELMDIREDARIAKDDDRYAVAQSRIDRLDAQNVERYNDAEGRLDHAQQQDALRLLGTSANPLSTTGGAGGGSPSAPGGSNNGQRSLNAVIARARDIYGASDEALVPFLGHGLSAGAIDAVLNEYDKFKETFAGKPGSVPSVDEFLSDSKIAFTPGAEVTEEMVIAGAKALNVSLTDQYLNTGSTWEEAITAQLKRQAGNGAYDFSTPSAPNTLDVSAVNEITTVAMGEVESYLNQKVRNLRKAIDDGDMDQAPALAAAEAALKKFENKTDTMEGINLYGADVILPILANAPQDALGGNNFGKFNGAIASRTYPNQASVLAAFKNGELSEDSWYVIDKTIYQVNPEGMKAAARGPLVQDGGQGNLGDEAGTLPGEGGVTEPLDLTGMSNQEMYGAILSGGLVVGDAIVVNGNIDYVTAATIEAAKRLAPRSERFASGFTPSTEFSTGEADGGAYGIAPDNLEYTGGRDQAAPDSGDVAAGFTTRTPYTGMSLKDSTEELARLNAAEVTDQDAINNLIEYMNDTWSPEDVSKAFEYIDNQKAPPPAGLTTSTSPEGQFEDVPQPDMEATRYPLESEVPTPAGEEQVNIGGISVLSSVVAPYVEAKGEPLAPEEELAIGIEAIVKGLSGNGMDQSELDALIIELQEKFGDEGVQEALVLAMNQ